jgi:hypothetical protein
MAEFNDETVRELNDSIRELTEVMQSAMGITGSSMSSQKSFIKGMGDVTSSASTLNARNKEVATSATNVSTANKAAADSAYKVGESFGKLYQASKDGRDALFSFSKAMLDTSQGVSKYGAAINQASGALSTGLGAFGVLGKTIGLLLTPFTKLLGVTLEYTDRIFEAKDSLAKFGATGRLTAKEIAEMGAKAGYSSAELGKYVKIVGSAGAGLVGLGGTVNSGVVEFAKLTETTKEERIRLTLLGSSVDDLNQNTADYIKMQTLSGVRISDEMKRSGQLKAVTREYTDNLILLSNLTGQSVDEIKKKQEAVLQEEEVTIANIATSVRIQKLREQGEKDQANALEREMNARNKLIEDVTAVQGPEIGKALAHRLATKVFTESTTKVMHNFEMSVEEMEEALMQGKNISDRVNKGYSDSTRARIEENERGYQLDIEFRKSQGINIDTMKAANLYTQEGIEQAKKDLEAKAIAKDAEEKSRAERLQSELITRLNMDEMASTINSKLMPMLDRMAKEIEKFTTMLTDPKFWADIKDGFISFMDNLKIAATALVALSATALITSKGGGGGVWDSIKSAGKGAASAGGNLLKRGGQAGMLYGAYEAGHSAGTFINDLVESKTGTSLSTRLADLFAPSYDPNAPSPSSGRAPAGKEEGSNQQKNGSDQLDNLFNFTARSGSKENFMELKPQFQAALIEAANEYNKDTGGKKITINSAKRSREDQQRLWDESVRAGRPGKGPKGMQIAQPGSSLHEHGLAVDINEYSDSTLDKVLRKHGLDNTVIGDPVHYTLQNMPGARLGGSFKGPNSGYPVMLHGPETVVPTPNPSTSLIKIEGEAAANKITNALSGMNSDALQGIMEQLYQMMDYKLSEMIDKLATGNDIQDKLLKAQM